MLHHLLTLSFLLLLALSLPTSLSAKGRHNPIPTFDVVPPLTRTWKLSRSFRAPMPSGHNANPNGDVTLSLSEDRVATFSTGEVGIWGVKQRSAGGRSESDYDNSFTSGICLEIEVSSPADGPIVLYTVPLAKGRYQPTSLRMDEGTISWLPSPFSLKRTRIGECKVSPHAHTTRFSSALPTVRCRQCAADLFFPCDPFNN